MSYVAIVCALVALTTLLAAGVNHLHHPRSVLEALTSQDVIPRAWVSATAVALVVTEVGLGSIGLLSIMPVPALVEASTFLLLTTAVVYMALSFYVTFVLKTRTAVACGCERDDYPISGWVVVRSILLVVASLVGTLRTRDIALLENARLPMMSVLSALGIAIIIWHLPAAMSLPRQARVGASEQSMVPR